MAKLKGFYTITWEIPDEDVPDEKMENEDWSDNEILDYFEKNGKKVGKPENIFNSMEELMEWADD